jgi:hypothetical protein
MDWEQKYNGLAEAVREWSNDPNLLHLIGPSEAENAAAEHRIKILDLISDSCCWDSVYPPSGQAHLARERWKRIMAEQGEFERRYC